MPEFKYKIWDLVTTSYVTVGLVSVWYSEESACRAYDFLAETYPQRYEIHRFKAVYPIIDFTK